MAKPVVVEDLQNILRESARAGLRRAYEQVRVDPDKFLDKARKRYRLPIRNWEDLQMLDDSAISPAANHIVMSSSRTAALEGAGLGFSGVLGTIPDMGILAAISVRMLQKLSLIHGFEYSTGSEMAGLWLAAASAAGLDCGREFLEKQAAEKLVPKLVDAVACKMGTEFAERWVGRLVPVLSGGIAGALNYHFVKAWGRRAQRHFIERRQILPDPLLYDPRVIRSLPSQGLA